MLKTEFKFSPSIILIFLVLIIPAFIGLLVFVYIANNKIADSISKNLMGKTIYTSTPTLFKEWFSKVKRKLLHL